MKNKSENYLSNDLMAGLVVFLVALPLCLGISLASGAPLFAGIIAGIVGGIVVGSISGSSLGVSGPAAGLTVIVLVAIQDLQSFDLFLVSVVLAGIFQIILSYIGAGKIAFYFPSSVIKGMLAAIGIIIILKQFSHAFGIDKDYEGDLSFFQSDGENTFTELLKVFDFINYSAFLIGTVCLAVLILWDQKFIKKINIINQIPGSLICVILGIIINELLPADVKLQAEHLVRLPVTASPSDFFGFFTFPDWKGLSNPIVWKTAMILAVIASLETLLCVDAADKLDPQKRITPTNRELLAQGVGNIVSGLVGGIPITQVVVRTSANVEAGGQTKISAIFHGIFLLICVIFIPNMLNKIPLAALAAVLIMVGYKLAKPEVFKSIYKDGQDQFIPFLITVVAIVFTDLLKGIGIGLAIGLGYVVYNNFKTSISSYREGNTILIKFNKDVFFYNRAALVQLFTTIKENDTVYIDGTSVDFIDFDIFNIIEDFAKTAKSKNINVELTGITHRKLNYRKSHAIISKTAVSQ
ncbi:MAG: SulP family inorganic anion transporter [Arcicella sp.]|nr:SulP family inorganic anion transporter [Arcicella sp.]